MRDYELVLIISPAVPDDAVEGVVEKVRGAVTTGGGEVVAVNPWGRRRLAYTIKGHREGRYVVITLRTVPEAAAELERGLRMSEDILRHLLVRRELVPVAERSEEQDAVLSE